MIGGKENRIGKEGKILMDEVLRSNITLVTLKTYGDKLYYYYHSY